MMTNKGDAQEMVQCPYEKSHHILKHRMQSHLVKCQRNHPDVKIGTCTFNATHHIPLPQLQHHLSNCPDRVQLDKFTYVPDNVQGAENLFPIPKLNVKSAECWDDDVNVPTYDPEAHCINNPILRNSIHTKSASVRRNFRCEERIRMQQFDQDCVEKQKQQPTQQAVTKARRPSNKSAAVSKNPEAVSLDAIHEELSASATKVTTPKVPTTSPIQNPLDAPQSSSHANVVPSPWSIQNLIDRRFESSPPSKGVGRGSMLAKKRDK